MNRILAVAVLTLAPFSASAATTPQGHICDTACAEETAEAPTVRLAAVLPATPTLHDVITAGQHDSLILVQSTTEPTPDWRATRDIVRQVQQILTTMGYNPGPVDGAMGPSTARAISEFEKDRDMEQTGEVTEALVAQLDAEINGQGGPEANGVVQETTEAAPPDIEEETMIEITDDPSTYDLGDLNDLNTFD